MPITKVGDIEIEYYVEGEGPPLLMLIGVGGHADSWGEPFLGRLREHFRIIRLSNRGMGQTDIPPGELTMRIMADDAVSLLRELGIGQAHVLGISMGGNIAQELVLNYPQMVQGLVLGCTNCGPMHSVPQSAETMASLGPLWSAPPDERTRLFMSALVSPEFRESDREFMDEMIELHRGTSPQAFGRQFGAIASFDSYERLPQIAAPTLIIHGDKDIIIPVENAGVLRERIRGAQAEIVPGVGHQFFWEKPAESAEAIVEFLASVPTPAA